ncbi:MAG: signal peptidase I [Maioricimonas sp. JB045]|uniref:signal peptidase I n=1 Tax=Maioricimonas sp. JC845 TaxID=3232138 RepID=UPI003457848A
MSQQSKRSREKQPSTTPSEEPPRKESTRETVESIVFAFILAFLFRTFEAEAFVIPTGSMAPTLYGRHKETTCEQCGYRIVIGASDEVFSDSGLLKPGTRITRALCGNCRYENDNLKDALAYNGDRILVNKYPYEFGDPDRFDVFVFKFPEEPETNYIKRLVGLPNETIRIRMGDLFRWDGQEEQILRKTDPYKQRRLQIPVYDDRHPAVALQEAGWPERWHPVQRGDGPGAVAGWSDATGGWSRLSEERGFQLADAAAPSEEPHWIRYRHFVPMPEDWDRILAGAPAQPQARLISDFCDYNAFRGAGDVPAQFDYGGHWVGDLTVNCTLTVDAVGDQGTVVFELCEGLYWYRCRIDVNTGEATLAYVYVPEDPENPNGERVIGTAKTAVQGPGTYRISFANVDNRLCLWVDDGLVDFGPDAAYSRDATTLELPYASDLAPAGVAARGVDAEIRDLVVERDIYYRVEFANGLHHENKIFERDLTERLNNPDAWRHRYTEDAERLDQAEYIIGPDEFLALGDNSPRSRDSRLWNDGMQTVPRQFLVGKAFFIYWPHGVPFMNGGRGFPIWYHKQPGPNGLETVEDYPRYSLPFYPQVPRMLRIR